MPSHNIVFRVRDGSLLGVAAKQIQYMMTIKQYNHTLLNETHSYDRCSGEAHASGSATASQPCEQCLPELLQRIMELRQAAWYFYKPRVEDDGTRTPSFIQGQPVLFETFEKCPYLKEGCEQRHNGNPTRNLAEALQHMREGQAGQMCRDRFHTLCFRSGCPRSQDVHRTSLYPHFTDCERMDCESLIAFPPNLVFFPGKRSFWQDKDGQPWMQNEV